MPDWITTKQAADLTSYSMKHIRRLVVLGKVKGQRFGRDWQISRFSLEVYVRKTEKWGAKRGPKTGV